MVWGSCLRWVEVWIVSGEMRGNGGTCSDVLAHVFRAWERVPRVGCPEQCGEAHGGVGLRAWKTGHVDAT